MRSAGLVLLAACAAPGPLVLHARGVQTYACKAGAWTFVAPKAELADDDGRVVGLHGAGPSWAYRDGSSVRGQKRSERVVDPDAIPWLVIDVIAHHGAGVLATVTTIERVRTHGGKAPAGACAADATIDVPYTADYEFHAAAP